MTTALYRRYRPDTFDQVIGQEHVTEPLKAALRANRVTHAYLFSGPRGCGKTTSARILARCLNCAQGPTDTPCGQCESCRELATGGPGSLDVVEIDAASHGGVDDARDLRERATFAPVRDRYKIFIIDEAHMVTNQGFNALLKLVEEPPEHVKFVFATTEPERVIGTIRSRTHHYPFRLVPPDVLGPYLTTLCAEEHISVGEGVLTLVMRAGGGSVRDTLSVLDQLMAGAIDGQVTYQTAVALLGYTDSALLDQSVDALAGGDGAAAFRVVERMVESGHDPRRFVEDLLQRLRDLLIIAVAGDGARDVLADTPHDQFERMQRQAQNWGPHGLSRAADLTDEALRAMTGATSPRLQLELLVGRILVPTPTAAPAPGPVQGTVGMTGGGAPREASSASSPEASSGRFGAREAREALARKKQERAEASAPSGRAPAPAASSPAPAAFSPAPAAQGMPAWGSGPDWGSSSPAPRSPEATPDPAYRAAQERPAGSGDEPPAGDRSGRFASERPFNDHPARGRGESPSNGQREWGRNERSDQQKGARQGERAAAQHSGGEAVRQQSRPEAPAQSRPERSGRPEAPAQRPSRERPDARSHEPARREVPNQQSARREAPAVHAPGGREADMLRGRWNEVVERLSSISRVTWSMVGGNAQLGAVDGSTVVLLFPVEAMVNAFSRGPRGADVEKAIREVTGLTVTVSAQVGQASGGSATTGPSAQASHPGGRPAQSQPGGWVSEPPPFDEAAAQAAYHDEPAPEPEDDGWPEPTRAPGPGRGPEPVRAPESDDDGGWPEPARGPKPVRGPEPVRALESDDDGGWPEPARTPEPARGAARPPAREESVWPATATVTPLRREAVRAEEQPWRDAPATYGGPTSYESGSAPQKSAAPGAMSAQQERPALPERAARALAQAPATDQATAADQQRADSAAPLAPVAPRKRSFTVFTYPGDPAPADQPSPAPAQADSVIEAPASSPVFDDAPIEPAAYAPITPTGWGAPVVIPGGASVSFEDGAAEWTPPEEPESAPEAAPASQEWTPQTPAQRDAGAQEWTPLASVQQALASQTPSWLAAAPDSAASGAPATPATTGAPATPEWQAASEWTATGEASPAQPGNDAPVTGRAAAEAALRDNAQRSRDAGVPRTHAADDDSASIDDENIENSQTIGLAAVLEILGGRVIEEKMTEGGY